MHSRREPMSDRDLAAIVDQQIDAAAEYDRTDLAGSREKALRYYEGEETLGGDVPFDTDRSRVVSKDLSDVHGWIMPSLLRVFLGSDRVVQYEPRRPGAEKHAQYATDYINYLFLTECNGYGVLHDAIWDGLLFGNGIIKHWWDDTPEYVTEEFSNRTEREYLEIVNQPDVEEVLEHTAKDDPSFSVDPGMMSLSPPPAPGMMPSLGSMGMGDMGMIPGMGTGMMPGMPPGVPEMGAGMPGMPPGMPDMSGGMPPGMPPAMPSLGVFPDAAAVPFVPRLHDFKIKRKISDGRLRIATLAPEKFRIDRNATRLDEEHVMFSGHVEEVTRSSLVAEGHDPAVVDELAAATGTTSPEALARGSTGDPYNPADRSTEPVERTEAYLQIDFDGDGIAEWRRVLTAPGPQNRRVLVNEEWGDGLPFTDLVPKPMPHHWRGQSLFDDVADLQRINTVFLRGINDNLYWINNPMLVALESGLSHGTMDKLIAPKFGAVALESQRDSIRPLQVPFIADKLALGLEITDRRREFRTGVSPGSMGLDPEALQNQTAEAVSTARTASYMKTEALARNISVGLTRLFRSILKLVVKHQSQTRKIRLRGEWVKMNPREWDPDMDVIVNVGLGSGSRDRDLAMLQAVAAKQELVVQGLGPMIAAQLGLGPDKVFETYRKMVEAAGLKSPEQYFPEITEKDVQAVAQQAASQPDPKAAETQAKVAAAREESMMKLQIERERMAMQSQDREKQLALEWQNKQKQAAIEQGYREQEIEGKTRAAIEEIRLKYRAEAEQAQRDYALRRQEMEAKIASETALKMRELELEAQLQRETMAMRVNMSPNIEEAE